MRTSDFIKIKCSKADLTFSLLLGYYCKKCGLCCKDKKELHQHIRGYKL